MYNIEKAKGILLDVGCGEMIRPNFIRLDKRKLPGIDIVHNLEVFPYPLPDECCLTIIASHIMEHIKPWFFHDVMNELWRITKVKGSLAVSAPYAGSVGYNQDVTHCSRIIEATFMYFDPDYPLYAGYRPKPWKIRKGFPVWQVTGNIECVMEKRKDGNS